MASSFVNSTLVLLGGAGLGAAAMFLLDPDQGEGRRRDIHAATGDALTSTGTALNATVQRASVAGKGLADNVTDYAQGLVGHATGAASDAADHVVDLHHRAISSVQGLAGSLLDAVKGFGKSAADTAKGYVDSATTAARSYADSAKSHAKSASDKAVETHDNLHRGAKELYAKGQSKARVALGEKPSHPYAVATGVTAGTVGVLAVGVGLMYFLDPERGRVRRSKFQSQVTDVTQRAGVSARRFGRNLGGKLKGYADDARDMTQQEWSSQFNGDPQSVADANG